MPVAQEVAFLPEGGRQAGKTQMRNEKGGSGGGLTLHMLDSAQGHPIQTWQFRDRERIRIGRSPENDISLADTQVSRLHAELIYEDGCWELHSYGRNGTQIDGEKIEKVRLRDSAIFQLGYSGPTFQYVMVSDSVGSIATIDNIDPGALDFLVIDEQRKAEEIEKITESEAFRQLQEQGRRFRQSSNDPEQDRPDED